MRSLWRISAVCLFAATLASVAARADHTRFWRTTDYSDFERGTAKGVALWSDGKLVPAAAFAPFGDPNLAYLWTLATDPQGRLYASGGSNARVFRFDAQGHPTQVFQSSELTAQAIAFDAQGDLYVGTSPDGKVYRVAPGGYTSAFFDPKTKYIWSLAVDRKGNVFVGTGDKGEIYVVAPGGKSALFYKSDERHIRALALDHKGDLFVGTDPNGLVIRIPIHDSAAGAPPTAGHAFVVYQTAGQEITALRFDGSGNLYAASIGARAEQANSAISAPAPTTVVLSTSAATTGEAEKAGATERPAPTPETEAFSPLASTESGSHVYRIAPDGSPKLLWASPTALVYALGHTPSGKVLLGTGNSGDVIELEGDGIFSKVADTSSGQVTGFATDSSGRVYLCTANPGKVFTLGPGIAPEGTFTSAPFDARIFSQWGRLDWWGQNASGGRVSFYARSGNTSNPNNLWSRWYGPYTTPQAQAIGSPAARFVQWKVVFHSSNAVVPSLSWVSLAYLPKNTAPEIDDVVMEDPGILVRSVVVPQMEGLQTIRPVRLRMPRPDGRGPSRIVAPEGEPTGITYTPPPQGFREKGWQSVLWSAHDPNGDQLEYSVYYRGEKEHTWKLLKKDLREPYYSWDTTTMPDGAYYLKIVASDAPSNPPGQALTDSRVSPRFVVDNTPPTVTNLSAQTATDDAVIQFSAHDPSTPLARAEYSLDAGPWTLVLPVGRLSDSPSENYRIELHGLAPGEHTITVRAFDLYENSGIAKLTFTVGASQGSGSHTAVGH